MSEHYLQANYHLSYYFPLPEGMCLCDLNDKTKVKEYYFAYNKLNIIFANGSATTIKPEMDKDFDGGWVGLFYKQPDTWFPIVKVDDELFCNEPFNHSDDDEIHCLHKQE
jgi:hypothetical protein